MRPSRLKPNPNPQTGINFQGQTADGMVTAASMIHLTRLNHIPLVLNSDLIEHIEITPDTVITLTNGQKIMVLESAAEIVDRVVAFRRELYRGALECPLSKRDGETAPLTEQG